MSFLWLLGGETYRRPLIDFLTYPYFRNFSCLLTSFLEGAFQSKTTRNSCTFLYATLITNQFPSLSLLLLFGVLSVNRTGQILSNIILSVSGNWHYFLLKQNHGHLFCYRLLAFFVAICESNYQQHHNNKIIAYTWNRCKLTSFV